MRYKVNAHPNLRIHLDRDLRSRIIGGLPQYTEWDFVDDPSGGRWKKLATRSGWVYAGDHGQFLTDPHAVASPRHILLFFGGYWEHVERRLPTAGAQVRPRPPRSVGVPGATMTPNED